MAMLDDAIAMQTMQYPGGPSPRRVLEIPSQPRIPSAREEALAPPEDPYSKVLSMPQKVMNHLIGRQMNELFGPVRGPQITAIVSAVAPMLIFGLLGRSGAFGAGADIADVAEARYGTKALAAGDVAGRPTHVLIPGAAAYEQGGGPGFQPPTMSLGVPPTGPLPGTDVFHGTTELEPPEE